MEAKLSDSGLNITHYITSKYATRDIKDLCLQFDKSKFGFFNDPAYGDLLYISTMLNNSEKEYLYRQNNKPIIG